ncbi:transposase [Vibrio sp. SS-MA-C1-2]|uniref:transposase n=1 Tax=Vibrio sp. SS-MA-C1-2 TaxID=2908646 RepID=UPI001F161220|nr:transposase [Vibrio sp. SS-MA-C1-2]UJF17480.1 transposase [Vibrio sp. SS-MA-C1-2]
MTTARSKQICLEATKYYHCVSRCVRRSFLCGEDAVTQKSFEHRRAFIESRMKQLSEVFTIKLCAYSIMSNHYHLVCCIDEQEALQLSNLEVINRWLKLHHSPTLITKYVSGDLKTKFEMKQCEKIIQSWRNRLYSLSWYMKSLNEWIATLANKEDRCTGHFWEGRFKCQALLDDNALIAAMAYVDLNPVRAREVNLPEQSRYTSIKTRIDAIKNNLNLPTFLAGFKTKVKKRHILNFTLSDYLKLLDWTGRQYRDDKSGKINHKAPSILNRININIEQWIYRCLYFEEKNAHLIGSKKDIDQAITLMGRKYSCGLII